LTPSKPSTHRARRQAGALRTRGLQASNALTFDALSDVGKDVIRRFGLV
jgi:hypothetical protein